MFFYHTPEPDQAMLVAGGKNREAPFTVVTGHGAFVMPFFRKVRYLSLAMVESEVNEQCVTQQGIALAVKAVIAFKVGNDSESIVNAAMRFLSDQDQMAVLTGRIFAGHLRSIIGSMTVEEIIRERQKLAEQVLDASKIEMSNLGLTVDSLQLQSVSDGDLGYIRALSAPHNAAVQRAARIAQAEADRASVEAEQQSKRAQVNYARETAVVQAQVEADVQAAQAKAQQSGPLAQAQAQQEVLAEQTRLAEKAAELRQQQLVAEVVRPAQADAERIRILAEAEARKIETLAAAAASHDRIALDQKLVEQMPAIMSAFADGLKGANLTVLNGAEGVSDIAASMLGQGLALFTTLRSGLADTNNGPAAGHGRENGSPNGRENGVAAPSLSNGVERPELPSGQ